RAARAAGGQRGALGGGARGARHARRHDRHGAAEGAGRLTRKAAIADALALDAEGAAAPPRSNGELVFEAPWESRAFRIAVALSERDAFEWERFRQRLIAEIGVWERGGRRSAEGWSYYERWLA